MTSMLGEVPLFLWILVMGVAPVPVRSASATAPVRAAAATS